MAQTGVIGTVSGLRPRVTVNTIRITTVVVLLALWEVLAAVGRSGLLYKDVVPSSIQIGLAIVQELLDPMFYHHLGITLAEHVVGFTIGSTIAVAVGIAMGANPFFRKMIEPYLNGIGSTPKIIFLPILFLLFGTGIESKMAKGALSAFFPVVFSTTLGMMLINPVLLRVGQTFSLTRRQMVSKIYMPSMVNPIITGLRLGMAIAVIGILVAEIKFSNGGLGYRIAEYYDQFAIASMYALIIIIFALAAAANVAMTVLQDRLNIKQGGSAIRNAGLGVSA
ncbi:MAG: ABC transporter permease subunit [Rhodospirillales bacterium]|nr:ABC transporter permease subunit [Rhodospirillales bacterium]